MLKEFSYLQELNKAGSGTRGARGQDPWGDPDRQSKDNCLDSSRDVKVAGNREEVVESQEVREQEESFWVWGGDWGSLRTL